MFDMGRPATLIDMEVRMACHNLADQSYLVISRHSHPAFEIIGVFPTNFLSQSSCEIHMGRLERLKNVPPVPPPIIPVCTGNAVPLVRCGTLQVRPVSEHSFRARAGRRVLAHGPGGD